MQKYTAAIFDLDGTIVDDELQWQKAFQNVADKNKLNKKITPIPGMSLEDSWKRNNELEKYHELAGQTREEFMEIIENEERVKVREGFNDLVLYLKEKGYLLGLATSSFWEITELVLQKTGVTGVFDAMTTGEEVAYLKPDPEIYRLTCQKLGVEPEETIVFEDAEAGIEAATGAGCKVIKIGQDFTDTIKLVQGYELE